MILRKVTAALMIVALVASVFMTSAAQASSSVTISANNADILSLSISSVTIDFGNISPDGTTGNYSAPIVDGTGAQYCAPYFQVLVTTNHPSWSLSGSASSSGTSNMDLSNIGAGPYGTCTGPVYSIPTGTTTIPSTPLASGGPGPNQIAVANDIWLYDKWTNTPGTLSVSISLTLT